MSNKHIQHTDKHPKQDFQVERLAFFSDAVFAIAITLLIIEFKVPHVTADSTFESVWGELLDLKYSLFSLLVSFALIATYWIRHHFLFKYVHNYNKRIVIANLFILLPIIFFPFTTAFFSESIENEDVVILGLRFFLINHILANISLYFFYWLALVKYRDFSFEMEMEDKLKFKTETIIPTITFSMILIISLFTGNFKLLSLLLLIGLSARKFIQRLLMRRISKKAGHTVSR